MPAPLFKRWVPPKPASTQQSLLPASSSSSSSSSSPPPRDLVVKEPSPAKKEKKSKKSKSEPESMSAKTIEGDEEAAETPKAIKKPKKRKRDSEVDEKQDEESPKKHKTIFSKFEKVSKQAEARREEGDIEEQNDQPEEELHDLQPMPQPAPVPEPTFEPTFSTLPTWLAQPVTIEASKATPFEELGVQPFFAKKLEKQGFKDALAVQTALLPMLHPGFEQHLGDICVSAKTGSGKTLAYLLPIIEALKDRVVPMLSAIIVVPSRQLVHQALQTAEELCAGTKIKVGTALGNIALAAEQKELVKLRSQYDPKGAKNLHKRYSQQLKTGFVEKGGIFDNLMSIPLDHVPRYDSRIDILICTPGRLVEHIEHTTGFLLNSVRWLVIDEADQLLNQNFQGWASVLMEALHGETPTDFMNAQERLHKREVGSIWSVAMPARRQLTKVVLSATMEKDLTKLGTLRLKRPKLVVVQDETTEAQLLENEDNVFELPSTLEEFSAHVGDGSNKPLHLLHVLNTYIFQGIKSSSKKEPPSDSSDSASSNEDDSDDDKTSLISTHKSRVLIFTKSNESASRLSHLLSVLEPAFKKYLKTMTRASTAEAAKKLLRSFNTGAVKILVASDAASRGLDVPSITHVINYDMPTSITSYVHRVGRTARAGKSGQAMTLFTKSEAAWFLNQIAKGDGVKRGDKKVKRLEWKESIVTADGKKKAYRAALQELEGAVRGNTEGGD